MNSNSFKRHRFPPDVMVSIGGVFRLSQIVPPRNQTLLYAIPPGCAIFCATLAHDMAGSILVP